MRDRRMTVLWLLTATLVAAGCAAKATRPAGPGPATPEEVATIEAPEEAAPMAAALPTAGAIETTAVAAVAAAPPNIMRIHLIDVGQGAATLLEFPCGTVLIDSGGEKTGGSDSTSKLLAYLDGFFGRRSDLHQTIDLFILTHPHIDHTRGAKAIVDRYTVKNVVTDGLRAGSGKKGQIDVEDWAAGHPSVGLQLVDLSDIPAGTGLTDPVIDPLACPGVDPDIRILWGRVAANPRWSTKAFENANNHSVVVRIDYGESSILVTGDLQEEAIGDLLGRSLGNGVLDVDVYEVGHHGSHNGTTEELVTAVTPEIALIAVGPSDRAGQWTARTYGHPRQNIVEMLQASISRKRSESVSVDVAQGQRSFSPFSLSKAIYATGWDGNVIVAAKPDGTFRVDVQQ